MDMLAARLGLPHDDVFTVDCFGPLTLLAGGSESSTPKSRKARALLAYLTLQSGQKVSRERAAGLLWSESPEAQARASLRQVLSELRPLERLGLLHITPHEIRSGPERLVNSLSSLRCQRERTPARCDPLPLTPGMCSKRKEKVCGF